VERARRLSRQAVFALELVHSQQVVHRDLKPSNILIATEGEAEVAKITDFGIVKRTDMNLHRTTTLAGASLGYAPPEQYEQGNDRVSPRTDLFSLAAIIFEMLSGQMAFPFTERENPLLIVTRILNGPRPELMKVRNQLAPELASRSDLIKELDVHVRRALSADPADRQPTVTEFWAKIEPVLREVSTVGADAPPSMLPFASTEASPLRGSVPQIQVSATQRSNPGADLAAPPVRVSAKPRVADPSSNPASWAWRIVSKPVQENIVSTASFSQAGDAIVAAGAGGLARWTRGTWAGFAPPGGMDPRGVRGLKVTAEGDLILFGDRSLAVRISPRGAQEAWNLPYRELSLRGVHLSGDSAMFVGERPVGAASADTMGVAAQFAGSRLSLAIDVKSVTRLNAVTRLAGGVLVAVGDRGALVRLDRGSAELGDSICRGHLVAIEPVSDGGAVTVGGGGHALYISPRLEAQLEAVQTTRDLCALAIGSDGAAWAGAAQARLLRRETDSWVRMSGDVGITPRIIAIWASAPLVRAVCDDGAVLEGRAA
jgi:serine/threonine-protein kinase